MEVPRSGVLERSISVPNLSKGSRHLQKIKAPRSEQLKDNCRTTSELVRKIIWLYPSFTTSQVEKILDYASQQFQRIQADQLYHIPKGYEGLEYSIFINGKHKNIFIPLKNKIMGTGSQNKVKKCIFVHFEKEHLVYMAAKTSRRLGFTEEEKNNDPHFRIKQERSSALAQNELTILKLLKTKPNVLQLIDGCLYQGSHKNESVAKMALFTDLFHCDLEQARYGQRLGNLSYVDKIEIVYQIANGLASSHSQKIVHKDLKSENVLISRFKKLNVVLADYGHSRFFESQEINGGLGTLFAWPPELVGQMIDLAGLSHPSHPSVDMWALGVLVHEMFYGEVEWGNHIEKMLTQYTLLMRRIANIPKDDFMADEKMKTLLEEQQLMKNRYQEFLEMLKEFETDEIDDSPESVVVHRLLRTDSTKRITAQEVVDILEGALIKLKKGP